MTAQIFKKSKSTVKLPQRVGVDKSDVGGKTQKGIIVCNQCYNTYVKKQWHKPGSQAIDKKHISGQNVRFSLCPACTMVKNHSYEGEIIIKKVPLKYQAELINLITGYDARAQKRDPQDRVIEIKKQKDEYRLTTTENQMAVKLSKQIKSVFNKVDVSISYAKEPHAVSRVKVTFL